MPKRASSRPRPRRPDDAPAEIAEPLVVPTPAPAPVAPSPGAELLAAGGRFVGSLWASASTWLTPAIATLALVIGLVNYFGLSLPDLPLPGPSAPIARAADRLADEHRFTAADRKDAAEVFVDVAEAIDDDKHQSATTVNAATLEGLKSAFGSRWSRVGLLWWNELRPQWKDRFTPSGAPDEYGPVWREVAEGLDP
ncbi:MAG TPA: hypothetical protein VGE52_04760 [Pirellulales bacterium]